MSVLSFLLSLGILAGIAALAISVSGTLLQKTRQSEDFSTAMMDVFLAIERHVHHIWQDSGCRALHEPPTLQMLIDDFDAPASLASKPYDIAIDYNQASNSFTSWSIKVIVTLPDTLNGYTLRKAAERVSESVFVTPDTLTLHQSMSSVNSQLQHSYFLSETGCMQGDYQ